MVGSSSSSTSTPPSISLLSGGIAGGVEGFLTYPFEFAKTRSQLAHRSPAPSHTTSTASPRSLVPKNPFLALRHIYRTEGGLRALYSGCSALVIGSIAKDAVRFLSFDTVKNAFKDAETGQLTPARNMFAGMAAGVVASLTAVTPSERIKTALIDDARAGAAGEGRRYTSTWGAVRTIVRENGLRGLYRGLMGTTLKQASATSFRMGSYNIVKDAEERRGIKQSTGVNFANGAVAGTVTTLATMPFDTVKTRCQSAKGMGVGEAVVGIWADGGVKGFWRGTVMRLSRTVVSGGILFTTAEAVTEVLRPIMGERGS